MNKAIELMQRAAAAGVTFKLIDGAVKIRGSRAARAELLEPLREVKADVQRILEDKAMPIAVHAEGYRLLTRVAAPPTTAQAQPPAMDGVRPTLDTPPPSPDRPWHHVDASWRPLAQAYHQHHTTCKACQAAGQGRGLRCGTGAALWTGYQEVFDQQIKSPKTPS